MVEGWDREAGGKDAASTAGWEAGATNKTGAANGAGHYMPPLPRRIPMP
jgi:hypothetical protein